MLLSAERGQPEGKPGVLQGSELRDYVVRQAAGETRSIFFHIQGLDEAIFYHHGEPFRPVGAKELSKRFFIQQQVGGLSE